VEVNETVYSSRHLIIILWYINRGHLEKQHSRPTPYVMRISTADLQIDFVRLDFKRRFEML